MKIKRSRKEKLKRSVRKRKFNLFKKLMASQSLKLIKILMRFRIFDDNDIFLKLYGYSQLADETLYLESTLEAIYYPNYFGDTPKIVFAQLQAGIYKFSRVRLLTETDIIFRDTYAAFDLAVHPQAKEFDFVFDHLFQIEKDYMLIYSQKIPLKIKEGVYIGGVFSSNYYHFVIEHLTKLYLLNRANIIPQTLLIDERTHNVSQFIDLLRALAPLSEIIVLEKGRIYEIENLIYPTGTTCIPYNLKNRLFEPEDCIINNEAVRFISKRLMDRHRSAARVMSEKIFLTRENVARAYNREDVESLFEKYGFTIVNTSGMTIGEQIDIFSNAKYIAGPTGASFTNIIFCKEQTKILIFSPQKIGVSSFSTLAGIFNLQMKYFAGDAPQQIEALHSGYRVDINHLEHYITSWLLESV